MSVRSHSTRRPLTEGELFVLEQIRDMYGPQNSEDQVFFRPNGDAVLFVTDQNGVAGLAVYLTRLAAGHADGTIKTVQELRERWLTAGDV